MTDQITAALDEIDWEGHDETAHAGALVALEACVKVAEEASDDGVLRALALLRDAFRATFDKPDGE